MDIYKFIKLRPYLYHLTDRENLQFILESGMLFSTKAIIELSKNPQYEILNFFRRDDHAIIKFDNKIISIRDQKPISERNLAKCLTNGWSCSDFYNHLNSRVFMWSKLGFLHNHYNTYRNENPLILRFNTSEIISANEHVKFCHLNSGATRSSSYHSGGPPPRGSDTFQSASDFTLNPSQVKEVTFENQCLLTGEIFISDSPEGIYKRVK